MDPIWLLAGAGGLAGYGYWRPTELFRHAVGARLRLAGLRSRHVRLPRARLRLWQGGHGEALVLVHGFGTEASVNWHAQLPTARRRFQVVAPDLPGFGASERIVDERTIAFQVECLRDLIAHLGCAPVHLVGHSMGGWISLAFAVAYPELVTRLVVVDAAGLRFDPDLSVQRMLLPETATDVQALMQANFQQPPWLPRFVLRDVLRTCQRDLHTRTEVLRQLAYGSEFLDDRFTEIVAPTLVVWGRGDPITPLALGERLAAGIPGAELAVFDDCAHSPNLERPARFNRLMLAFLEQGGPAQRALGATLAQTA
jgi:pimeloyl-ACP methyl ester carboxylesterase